MLSPLRNVYSITKSIDTDEIRKIYDFFFKKKVLFNYFGNKKWKNETIQRFLTHIISIFFCAKCYKQVRFVGLTYQKTKRTNAMNVLIWPFFTIFMDSNIN